MEQSKKKELLREAELQLNALRTIRRWLAIAIGLSTMGGAVAYWGFAGAVQHAVAGSLGILLAVVSLLCALVINYGMRNGQRNVKKILELAK